MPATATRPSPAFLEPAADTKKASRIDYPDGASEFGPLKRSTYTFQSFQEYEDKLENVSYGQFASVSALGSSLVRTRSRTLDVETQAGITSRPKTESQQREKKITDDSVSTAPTIVVSSTPAVPTFRLTKDDESTSTAIDPAPSLDEDDHKESYDFLNRDGRWHNKPHVYEYNKASSRLLQTAQPHLFGKILQKDRSGPKKCVLNVATMQAMILRTYQSEIIEAGKELSDGKMSVLLPQLIHKYCEALRDMDYIEQKAANGFEGDPFLLMTSKQMERELMEDHQLIPEDIRGSLPPAFDASHPILPGLGRTDRIHKLQLESRYHKLYSALGGGLALIIPMIIMRLEPGKTSCLVTTSGCVLIFSIVIAFRSSDMKPHDILAVTAAYTAVLVVFVGTTIPTHQSSHPHESS